MTERVPTMRELRASLTHTGYCSVLQRGAFDRPEVCTCWCHDKDRPPQAPPTLSTAVDPRLDP
jgi:hypothetical protein